jgi:formate dehydrogenase major subunit
MANKDKEGEGFMNVSRRDFLKVSATAAAVGGGWSLGIDPSVALAYESDPTNYQITCTTCPYCSASCGQRVVKALTGPDAGKVVDIYGDFESPMNSGGLCAKGAGSIQLVNNTRRLAAFDGAHPVNPLFAHDSADDAAGVAYRRVGNGLWEKRTLDAAMTEIAGSLFGIRGALPTAGNNVAYNSKSVAFFGSSHLNNDANYLYRKIIANFGTSNVEHQARI